jgi:hypothetical protein
MRKTRPSSNQKLISFVTAMSLAGGLLCVVGCFVLLLAGNWVKIPIFYWRTCWFAFLVVLVTFLCTFWVMMAGEGGISFVLYLILVWSVELGAIVSGAIAFSGALRYAVVALLAFSLVLINWQVPVLRVSVGLVFNTFKDWRNRSPSKPGY